MSDADNLPALAQPSMDVLATFQNGMQVDLSMVADAAIAPLETELYKARATALAERKTLQTQRETVTREFTEQCHAYKQELSVAYRDRLDAEMTAFCTRNELTYSGTSVSIDVGDKRVAVSTSSEMSRAFPTSDFVPEGEFISSQQINRTLYLAAPEFVLTYNTACKAIADRLQAIANNIAKITDAENRLPSMARQTRGVVAKKLLQNTDTGKAVLEELGTNQAKFMEELGLE